ncbi:MAG TPA: hypothetical protein VKX28_29485 [Xanthobacteraceae bacterium]|jgi:hypothetical protein|nr:hypothetical protein [Xanthobacteraceae bacterium]
MRRMIPLAAAIALAAAASGARAASDAPYKTRLEECEHRAKAMKFGIHFIRRDRWIRACLRGKV